MKVKIAASRAGRGRRANLVESRQALGQGHHELDTRSAGRPVGADNRILGFTMIGSEASEVMAAVQTAMLAKLPYPVLREAVIAHLTMAEGSGRSFQTSRPDRTRRCRYASSRHHQSVQ